MASVKIGKPSLFFKNYMAMIGNSLKTKMFRNFYLNVNGEEKDILENGRLSCAVFVSSVLILQGLIQGPPRGPHAIVKSLVKNMEDASWKKIKKPRPGAVLIWEPMKIGERVTDHVGFFWDNVSAISNNSEWGTPQIHHWTYGVKGPASDEPFRKVIAIYWHDKLGK